MLLAVTRSSLALTVRNLSAKTPASANQTSTRYQAVNITLKCWHRSSLSLTPAHRAAQQTSRMSSSPVLASDPDEDLSGPSSQCMTPESSPADLHGQHRIGSCLNAT